MIKNKIIYPLALGALVLSGCATNSVLDKDARNKIITKNLSLLEKNQPDLVGMKLTLPDAIARALLFNMDVRTKAMEQAVELGQLSVENLEMLPQLTAKAGYSVRSKQSASYSKNLITNTVSADASTSTDKKLTTASLGLTWNILDFGQAYLKSQQQSDNVLIAQERRRQTMQNIISDVRLAFWQAYAGQHALSDVNSVIKDTKIALSQISKLEREFPTLALQSQAELLETLQKLLQLKRNIEKSPYKLAALINIKPGKKLHIVAKHKPSLARLRISNSSKYKLCSNESFIESLERRTLLSRPELRISDYNVRIRQKELKKVLISMLPGVGIDFSHNYTNNSFAVNNKFSQLGLSVNFNIFNLFKYPAHKRAANARLALEEQRRLAFSLAALTQLHVSIADYNSIYREMKYSTKLKNVNFKILKHQKDEARANGLSEREVKRNIEVIISRLNSIQTHISDHILYADLQNALGRVYVSLGEEISSPVNLTMLSAKMNKSEATQALKNLKVDIKRRVNQMRNFNKYLKQTANVSCSNVSQTSKKAIKMQTKVKAKAKINKSAKAITLEKFDKEITSKTYKEQKNAGYTLLDKEQSTMSFTDK